MIPAHKGSTPRSIITLLTALGLVACSGGESGRSSASAESAPAQDIGRPSTGMDGMTGMQGSSSANGMMEQMQAHILRMDGVSADSTKELWPTHRQMVANMISQFDRDMVAMKMSGDAAWTATMDTLRRDLTQMSEMTASELQQFKLGHNARVMRMMEFQRTMMVGMRM